MSIGRGSKRDVFRKQCPCLPFVVARVSPLPLHDSVPMGNQMNKLVNALSRVLLLTIGRIARHAAAAQVVSKINS